GDCGGWGFDGDTVEVGDEAAGDGGDAFAGDDDSYQVERIGGGNCDGFAGGLLIARGAEGFDGDGGRELFAREAGEEAAAANFAAIVEAAESQEHLAPTREDGFAGEEFAEDNSVAIEEHAAGGLERGGAVFRLDGIE